MKCFRKVNLLKCARGQRCPYLKKHSKRLPTILKLMMIHARRSVGFLVCLFSFFVFLESAKRSDSCDVDSCSWSEGEKHIQHFSKCNATFLPLFCMSTIKSLFIAMKLILNTFKCLKQTQSAHRDPNFLRIIIYHPLIKPYSSTNLHR